MTPGQCRVGQRLVVNSISFQECETMLTEGTSMGTKYQSTFVYSFSIGEIRHDFFDDTLERVVGRTLRIDGWRIITRAVFDVYVESQNVVHPSAGPASVS